MYTKRVFPPAMLRGLLLVLCASCTCWAHGSHCLRLAGAIGVQATYDNGDPFVEADVLVFAPENRETPWLSGKTDRQGRFFFVPDADGSWLIRIKDAEGHAASNTLKVANRAIEDDGRGEGRASKGTRVLIGLAIVFGLFGLFSLVRRR